MTTECMTETSLKLSGLHGFEQTCKSLWIQHVFRWTRITFHQLWHPLKVSARYQQGPLEFGHHIIPILGPGQRLRHHIRGAICTLCPKSHPKKKANMCWLKCPELSQQCEEKIRGYSLVIWQPANRGLSSYPIGFHQRWARMLLAVLNYRRVNHG